MGRSIEQENSFLQVLLKLIPSEVIAVYVFVQGVLPGRFWVHLAFALLLVGLTPMYLAKACGVKSTAQLVLSTLSLVVWVYAMGTGPLRFVHPPYYEPWHGAALLAVWTLVPPMLLTQGVADMTPHPVGPRAAAPRPVKRPGVNRPSSKKRSAAAQGRRRAQSAGRQG